MGYIKVVFASARKNVFMIIKNRQTTNIKINKKGLISSAEGKLKRLDFRDLWNLF